MVSEITPTSTPSPFSVRCFRLRFRSASEALEEPLRLRTLRRDIARLQTVARERALGIVRNSNASAPARGTKKTATKAAAKKPSKARSR